MQDPQQSELMKKYKECNDKYEARLDSVAQKISALMLSELEKRSNELDNEGALPIPHLHVRMFLPEAVKNLGLVFPTLSSEADFSAYLHAICRRVSKIHGIRISSNIFTKQSDLSNWIIQFDCVISGSDHGYGY